MSWLLAGNDSYAGANELFARQRWRSVISRAYYASYSRVTHELVTAGVSMPAGREGPHHTGPAGITVLTLTHLRQLRQAQRNQVSGKLMTLYDLRVLSDYRPRIRIDRSDAQVALGLMVMIFQLV